MWLASIKLLWKQSRITYFLMLLLGTFLVVATIYSNPGEAGIKAFYNIMDSPFGNMFLNSLYLSIGVSDPLYAYFLLLYFVAYMVNVFPLFGLWLGSSLPDEVSSSMADLFIASPNKKRSFAIRYILGQGVLFTVISIFLYLEIPIVFILTNHALNYERISYAFVLLWISGMTYFSIAFTFSVTTLRTNAGRAAGGFVFLFSLFDQFFYNTDPSFENFKYLSVFYYTNPSDVLYRGTGIISDNIVPLVIVCFLLIIGVFIFVKRDLLPVQGFFVVNKLHNFTLNKPQKIFQSIKNALFPIDRVLHRISPISAEQWEADKGIFLFVVCYLIITAAGILAELPAIMKTGYAQAFLMFGNNPLVKSLIRDYNIFNDPIAPFYPQFYGYTWIYFAPVIVIAAGRILERDLDTGMIDIMRGMPISPRKMLFMRLFTVLVELILLSMLELVLLLPGELLLGLNEKIFEQCLAFILIPMFYFCFLCICVGIGVLFSPANRKKAVYGFAVIMIILAIFPYMNASLEWSKYFSLLYYFDLVGLIHLGYQVEQVSMLVVPLILCIIAIFLIYKKANTMLQV